MLTQKKQRSRGNAKASHPWAYPVEFRLQIVKLFLEEGYSAGLIREEFGISHQSIRRWAAAYRQRGLSALLGSVTDQLPGRPPDPLDDHHQWLEKQLQDAKREIDLLNHKMALKDVLTELKRPQAGSDRTKKMIGSGRRWP